MQKYTKIQASVQHGLYLFTCEISSVNSNGAQTRNNIKEVQTANLLYVLRGVQTVNSLLTGSKQ